MTIREHLNKKRKKYSIISFSGIALFVTSLIYSIVTEEGYEALSGIQGLIFIIGIVGFFVGAIGVILELYKLSCPSCKEQLGYALTYPHKFFSISKKLKFCPFCGVNFDTSIEGLDKDLTNG